MPLASKLDYGYNTLSGLVLLAKLLAYISSSNLLFLGLLSYAFIQLAKILNRCNTWDLGITAFIIPGNNHLQR